MHPYTSLPSTCEGKEPVSSQSYIVGRRKEKLINGKKRVSDLVSGETFSPMNSNVSQEGQGCCGASVLGDFHTVQSPGFNPRIA